MARKLFLLAAGVVLFTAPAWGDSVADFYKGKTVRIVVGFGPGGTTDTTTRLLAHVLSKHIPGNPRIVVQNKPGGGSMLAANTVFNNEPKDGTVIVALSSDLVLKQARGEPGIRFDAKKLQWLGSAFDSSAMCAVRTDAGVNNINDAKKKKLVLSSFGKGGLSHLPAVVFNEVFGTQFKVVTGYPGGAAQRLAVKNGEVQGFCTTFQTAKGTEAGMFEGPGKCCRVLIIAGTKKEDHPFLDGVPAAGQLAKKLGKSEAQLAMLSAMNAPNRISIPHALPPGVPKERVKALRDAFAKSYSDPEFRKLTDKAGMEVIPKNGEQVTVIVDELLATPKPVLENLKKLANK